MPKVSGMSPGWKREPHFDRLRRCALMLYLHGMLTDAEHTKVSQRILKADRLSDLGVLPPDVDKMARKKRS